MNRLPPTLHHYLVPQHVLPETRSLLREGGLDGMETVVVWVGYPLDATTAQVITVVRPGQVAYRGDDGCSVEVPQHSLSELINALPEGMFILARLHTHPGIAFHSPVDDTNMLISHNHAISIVVPYFAHHALSLAECSVNELIHGQGWRELTHDEVADRFEIR